MKIISGLPQNTKMCVPTVSMIFFQELIDSMKGLGTKDEELIRVITTRAEIDMYYIKQEFHALTRKTLEAAISSETSGEYQHFLLSLVGGY